jgi:hypothetical protein
MKSRPTIRFNAGASRPSRVSFVLVSMAVLIFAWGLQYKLSLYAQPNSISRHMVHAKLASNDKQVAALESMVASRQADPAPVNPALMPAGTLVSVLLLAALLAPFLPSSFMLTAEDPRRAPWCACFNAFFFRPPPFRG